MARQLPLRNSALAPSTVQSALSIAVLIAASGWLLVHQAGWPTLQVGTALIGYAILALCVAIAAIWHLEGPAFGLANKITLLRAGLVCLVGSEILAGAATVQTSWSLAALIAFALSLDAIDGWLARRLGSASSFGARFDLEVDALMLMILSVLVWQADRAGPWVLAIGLLRYGFRRAGAGVGRRPQTSALQLPPQDHLRGARRAAAGLPAATDPLVVDTQRRRHGISATAAVLWDRSALACAARHRDALARRQLDPYMGGTYSLDPERYGLW